MKEEVGDVTFKMRKMSWLEAKIRRWWMQRQLWNSYKKAITLAWTEYEVALKAKDKERSDELFKQCTFFRIAFERNRDAIDALFKSSERSCTEKANEKIMCLGCNSENVFINTMGIRGLHWCKDCGWVFRNEK